MAAGIIQKVLRRSIGLLGMGFRSYARTALLLIRFGEAQHNAWGQGYFAFSLASSRRLNRL